MPLQFSKQLMKHRAYFTVPCFYGKTYTQTVDIRSAFIYRTFIKNIGKIIQQKNNRSHFFSTAFFALVTK